MERATEIGLTIYSMYGSTEHPSITGCTYDDPLDKRLSTAGRPLPGCEIKLVDPEGHEVGAGEPGEILSRGPECFLGYTDASLTAKVFDEDGWYHTGDIGVLDPDGYLSITDRISDVIIRGGENISAAEVEEVLMTLAGVAEVAVVAAPDARMGEHAAAFVRMVGGRPAPELPELRQHLETAGVARQKWPEELISVDDFPAPRRARCRSTCSETASATAGSDAGRTHSMSLTVPDTLEEVLDPAWLSRLWAERFPGIDVASVQPGPIVSRVSTNARFHIECRGNVPPGLPTDLCVKGYFADCSDSGERQPDGRRARGALLPPSRRRYRRAHPGVLLCRRRPGHPTRRRDHRRRRRAGCDVPRRTQSLHLGSGSGEPRAVRDPPRTDVGDAAGPTSRGSRRGWRRP